MERLNGWKNIFPNCTYRIDHYYRLSFLQGLFTICNMQRVTEQVYYMKIIPGVSFCALESWYCCAWLPENVR